MRSPICAFLGHVDAGKTSIMDAVRDTFFAYRESGGLTQNIGVTEVPTDRINEIAADLLKRFKVEIKAPSIVFIDSPGHEAFITLRERGASIADLAILTIDVTEGVQKQTLESIEILKSYKTPFLIALTKIDTVHGYLAKKDVSFIDFIGAQNRAYSEGLDKKLYDVATEISNYGFTVERYDRVKDFTKEVSVVPVSAVNNIGIKDLIVMIIGLSQRYIPLGASEGNTAAILEEKPVKGIGQAYDAIVYSGTIRVGDRVLGQTKEGAKENRIKAIMRLMPLEESRENFGKYEAVKAADATSPVRLVLQDPSVLIGTSISAFGSAKEKESILEDIQKANSGYNDDKAEGVVVCSDSLGSLDAIKKISDSNGIKIGKTRLGEPSKADITTARLNGGVLLCFNVQVSKQTETLAEADGVKIIQSKAIYDLFERYKEFAADAKKKYMSNKTADLRLPSKIIFIKGNLFRRSNPCVFGIEVLAGEIRPGYPMIDRKGEQLGRIIDIQGEKKKLDRAVKGDKVAISVDAAVYGRNIKEEDVLYTNIDVQDIIKFEDVSGMLGEDYREALEETRKIKKL